MARPARFLAFLAVLAACSDGGGTGPAPALSLSGASGPPMAIVTGSVTGVTVPSGPISGTLGAEQVSVMRIADDEIAFVIPSIAAGSHTFSVDIGGSSFSGTVNVTAAPPVADAAAYLDAALDAGEAEFDALEAALGASPDATALDTAQRRQDLARIRSLLSDARQRLASATPDELAEAAAFLAANGDALGLTPSTQRGGTHGLSLQTSSGACLDEFGNQLDTYEACSAKLTAFGNDAVARLVALAAVTAVAYVEGATVVGILAAAATAIVVYKELAKIQDGTFARFIDPVMAKLKSPFAASPHRALSLQTQGGSEADEEYFVKDRTRAFRVIGEYRSLRSSDATVSGLSTMVSVARKLETIANGIRAALLMSPIRPLVPASPYRVVTRDIPPEYLSLGGVGGGVSGAEVASDTAWMLRFTRASLASDAPFTFAVRYEPPALPAQEMTVPGMLIPTPRFIARSLANGTLGSGMCAFDVNGAAYCWGQNQHGRLGDLTTTDRTTPTRLKTGLDLVALTVGDTHTCGVTQDGTAKCWGSDWSIGDSARAYDYNYRLSSGIVERGLTYTNLTASRNSTCGLRGGAVVCWGPIVDKYDTTGMATLPHWGVPLGLPGNESFVTLDMGNNFGCGLSSTGAALCFGWNYNGQLGNGTQEDRGYAVPVAGGRSYTKISTGDTHVCALDASGQAWCWGNNAFGQIGDDYASAGAGPTTTPVAVSGGIVFAQIEAGAHHTCGLTPEGKAYCWGGQSAWVIGTGEERKATPSPVATTLSFSVLSAGNEFTCGIAKGGGGLYCWGMNNMGELGLGFASSNEGVSAVAAPE